MKLWRVNIDTPVVPAPFRSSVSLHEMTFPFLSDRNPLWTRSGLTSTWWAGWLVDWLVGLLVGWLVGWLVD